MANVNIEQLNIKTTFVGMVESEEWSHFLWSVLINDKVVFEYKTGLGLVTTKKLMSFNQPNIGGSKVNRKNQFIVKHGNEFFKAVVVNNRIGSWLLANPTMPTNKDILFALLLDSQVLDESYQNWCDNYGYDSDSMKAFKIYQACCDNTKKLQSCFSSDELANIAEQLQDY